MAFQGLADDSNDCPEFKLQRKEPAEAAMDCNRRSNALAIAY
jgi:hypothetical protein